MAVLKSKPKGSVANNVLAIICREAPKVFNDPSYTWAVGLLLWSVEIVLNVFIIYRVKYTEIDWIAYMQEVEGFLNGTKDYMLLKGDTGPLVYPAGFVYFYSILYYVTSLGRNIKLAQYVFFVFYLFNLLLVIRIYHKTLQCPPYVLIFMCCTSYRVHSIFVLRLFNDPVAILVFYLSVNCFLEKRWYLGSFLFSLAVSVKMNVLLFAPGLLMLFLVEIGIRETACNLLICGLTQVALAIPFLAVNPVGYVVRSFDLGRQFQHKWTVNWRFLSEGAFADRRLHLFLLFLHISVLFLFAAYRWRRNISRLLDLLKIKDRWSGGEYTLSNNMVQVLFTSNLIGICFARSLHYQFYIWYYHTLPYLFWCTSYSTPLRLLLFGLIELCWNTYPSTNESSLCLHACHLLLLVGLWRNKGLVLDSPGAVQSAHQKVGKNRKRE